MQKKSSDGPTKLDQMRDAINGLMKRTRTAYTAFCMLAIVLLFAGCSGGGGEGVSSQTVSGVAATGAPLAGQVKIKDSSTLTREKATVIANDGSFALDVTDMKAPFVLQATGTANGTNYTLHSFASGPGTANINPLSDAAVANAAGVSDPTQVYEHPDSATLKKIEDNLSKSVTELQDVLKPLMTNFSSDKVDPIKGHYKADHTGLDDLFDNVQITIINGIITVTNLKTGAVIYTGSISDLKHGHFTEDDDDLPNPGAVPTAPHRVTATGGAAQVTITWRSVGNATSYNIYWSTTSGVTISGATTDGKKISGAASPYVHTGLSASTAYYYVVTAVNSAGESAASSEATATTDASTPPPATAPAKPTGVQALAGTNQVTITWTVDSAIDTYNIYWSTTAGMTKSNGKQLPGVTSGAVHNNLTNGTTYYYVVTAVKSGLESADSDEVLATPFATANPPPPTVPAAPTGVGAANNSSSQITVSWSAITGATYNLYRSLTSGFATTAAGVTKMAGVSSPYADTGLSANTTYYYRVTAINGAGEGSASAQASATTDAVALTLCFSCHGTPPATGHHATHFPSRTNTCATCHGVGFDPYGPVSALPSTHKGVIDIASGDPPGWDATTKNCTNTCHGGSTLGPW
jgi:fibronectin type 3 domain-containing protein